MAANIIRAGGGRGRLVTRPFRPQAAPAARPRQAQSACPRAAPRPYYICRHKKYLTASAKAWYINRCKVYMLYSYCAKENRDMEKNVRMCMLLDCYSLLLTQKQSECMRYYYEEDLSLAEISELLGISRQGVRDCIKKAEGALEHMESNLGLIKSELKLEKLLKGLKALRLPEVDELLAQFEQASEDENGI